MKKLFIFHVDNTIDLITNSSSELFVLEGDTKEIVTEMIQSVYPDFRNEYEEVKRIDELTNDELDGFISYHCSPGSWPAKKSDYPIIPGFTFEELYEPESDEPAWNGEIQYRVRNNVTNPEHRWDSGFVTKENREEVIKKLDPGLKTYFLYSINENPNWDYQEQLMGIASRYHLG